MKKLTLRFKNWLYKRAAYQQRERRRKPLISKRPPHVEIFDGTNSFNARLLGQPYYPPRTLCFHRNKEETLKFLDITRKKLTKPKLKNFREQNSKDKHPSIKSYHDLSQIEEISTSAALIYTAEYERAKIIAGKPPYTVNLSEWSNPIFSKLYELGFFEIVGITDKVKKRFHEKENVRSMKIVSGKDNKELKAAAEQIKTLLDFLPIKHGDHLIKEKIAALNSAIGEAITNVCSHAYPEKHKFEIKHVDKWWITATARMKEKSLTISFYDQGVTIPITFPKKDLTRSAKTFLQNLRDRVMGEELYEKYKYDAAYIRTAMIEGHSQTKKRNRGKGLAQMVETINICKSGSLYVYSRGGAVRFEHQNNEYKLELNRISIGGTLIEWNIAL